MKSISTLILILMALSSPKVMALDAEKASVVGRFFRDMFGFSTKTLWAQDVQAYISLCAFGVNTCPDDDVALKLGIDLNKFYNSDVEVSKKYIDDLQDETSDAYKYAHKLMESSTAMVGVLSEASARKARADLRKAIRDAKRNPKP